jgi:hypothetical protein
LRFTDVHGRRWIADLVCVVTADTAVMWVGDLLVVANKRSMVEDARPPISCRGMSTSCVPQSVGMCWVY